MSKFLLDTHTFIWFVSNDAKLPESTRNQIESADAVFLSIVSIWEIAIKLSIGKLHLQGDFEEIEPQLITAGITMLNITFSDTVHYRYLPLHHGDPFDRMLIAQAINHGLVLVSRDRAFDPYPVTRLWG
ncbi:type II toxin-antitoxin system VapC family toxin [[Phormidium] sp. ETS-05]|uniref:type II toxin-antitoxin system VapC family toxin n=1 Tax=[Phormidium] sp. ETS-05 TaxID=222819 RepID=UPI0018EF2956|nr:type II toxin-antitoxin system VapC family toxin [[Phormidium] sp. ETS-05]